jgi:hypothetical protein
MRNLIYLSLLILFVSIPGLSQGNNIELYIGGGISAPSKPQLFSENWSSGYGYGGGIGINILHDIHLMVMVDYSKFEFDADTFLKNQGYNPAVFSFEGGSSKIFSTNVYIKTHFYQMRKPVTPYIIGGLGYFKLTTNPAKVSKGVNSITVIGDSESAFNFQVGLGFDIPYDDMFSFFIEGKYGVGLTKGDKTTFIPVRAGAIVKF